jgi:hypothetical protein
MYQQKCPIYQNSKAVRDMVLLLMMLREDDHTKFFEAMEIEINDHEARRHWDLMLRTDLPLGSKTIMAIW